MEQSIGMTKLPNARELGGYTGFGGKKIIKGRLLRSAFLSLASEEDLKRLTDELNLRLIVDFRADDEAEERPDPVLPGVRCVRINVMDPAAFGDPDEKDVVERTRKKTFEEFAAEFASFSEKPDIAQFYAMMVQSGTGAEGFARFFREILSEPGGAVLWHCAAGKDRTGVAAALLLTVLGVDRETIIRDYLLTNVYCRERIDRTFKRLLETGYEEERARKISGIWEGAAEEMMRNAFLSIEKSDGSAEGYIRNRLGLTDEDFETLRERYLA